MNKSDAKYAASSADLVAQFVQDADSTMIAEFCSRFEILVGEKHRAKAEEMAKKLSEEFLSTKEAQKSGSELPNKDSPTSTNNISTFGTKAGSKQFVIDEMIASGQFTLAEIENESKAPIQTVKRRIRKLKEMGYHVQENNDGKIAVVTSINEVEKEQESDGKRKRKRKRKEK